MAQAAFPIMEQQNYGRIVLTTSDRAIYEQYALSGLASYAMGKMAQLGLMNVLSVECKEHGILVNAISPVAKTRMWNVQDEPEDLRPDQVAPGVLYLASPECRESGFILRASNGQFTAVRWTERDNVDTKEYPVEALVQKYGDGEIHIASDSEALLPRADCQELLWDETTQSKFIETLLLGLPVPYIFVVDVLDAENGQLEIVDGTQRILTLVRFLTGRIMLSGLEVLQALNGFTYADLPVSRQRRFNRHTLRVIEVVEEDGELRQDIL